MKWSEVKWSELKYDMWGFSIPVGNTLLGLSDEANSVSSDRVSFLLDQWFNLVPSIPPNSAGVSNEDGNKTSFQNAILLRIPDDVQVQKKKISKNRRGL
jgi:hypothetical protein